MSTRRSMTHSDSREAAARFYDLQEFADDVPFYRALVPSPACSILDLGCGTGRVALGLADVCASVHGIEISASMLAIAHEKIEALPDDLRDRLTLVQGDITDFDLGRTFDLIIAPFRVFQALEIDEQVEGLFHCVRRHLAEKGTCILTMFNPMHDPDTMRREWVRAGETDDWARDLENGERIVATDRRPRLDSDKLVLYPELIYRRYRGDELLETVVMPIAMRCWYPDQITALIVYNRFCIVATWGGYCGERFGEGGELIVQFAARD